MATYSLAVTGVASDQFPSVTENLDIPDAAVPLSGTTLTTATLGGMQNAMRLGLQLPCRLQDGSVANYTLDASRFSETVPVLNAVK